MHVSAIDIYPIKSCRGIPVRRARVVRRGLEHDHRFMVVDEEGVMITQRNAPSLATVTTTIRGKSLLIGAEGCLSIVVPLRPRDTGQRQTVFIHEKPVEAMDMGETVALWFSSHVKRRARLVWFPNTTHRYTSRDPSVEVAFQDGYPLLVLSEASLVELNRRMVERGKPALPMDRFRPNIVVSGCARPHEEDEWAAFEVGTLPIRGVKLCARCRITQTDQALGKLTSGEPMRTLGTYRAREVDGESKNLFGLNANHRRGGILRVGDGIVVTNVGDISP